jgi:hypothetical protein
MCPSAHSISKRCLHIPKFLKTRTSQKIFGRVSRLDCQPTGERSLLVIRLSDSETVSRKKRNLGLVLIGPQPIHAMMVLILKTLRLPYDLESLMKLATALLISAVVGIAPALAQSASTTTTKTPDGDKTTTTWSDGSSATTTNSGGTSTTTYRPPGSAYTGMGRNGYNPMGHN